MNNPEYSFVNEIGAAVAAAAAMLTPPNAMTPYYINYQYGYLEEVNETLIQDSRTVEYAVKKYPLVWLVEPFTVVRRNDGFFGSVDNARIFIITGSTKTLKAAQRRALNIDPILHPIYRALIVALWQSSTLQYSGVHTFTDRYYWGEKQQSQLNDVVDCSEIDKLQLKIYNNTNC